ncbi:MAG: 16S rRNA (cytidine(1402)-2'-O)-methyltransferase [Candidatus Raymondbacteria bacterium RifOxyA12_full_50_37]|uniref:Ribosomal RNA small subunit methyltransferase I n=1 Tax=Candidatus Raymondbacteria bacterium RIFOXYD12_FULL_49_13 TaxID=1817890 RepID=A0A1F7FDC5_UNCRA|nr:MAG: 16S rRNA (cytidine(1402)-2'-O)-methyltransferase [Candidatus Raymondbacteria bacterium RIFOXYA2_FULL_49_16]OGJ88163.1 MAG: 16S rRNA (cytidine(1402)-2'-O)-methyltransferase [Candidatus Raymondbacteria bacterium RifOxyA12_full_50_37]OGJ93647.1 MAG: 16S rRNA (cytidine(1402)-2'-O)-methyltransferase [Candidatus Raymondbacteria bacterium RifOxyB12_full_50_8]OGJ96965.1 MAG: 16S rRNA (cytidine(1402)-2'-O)-methyltransferase [Candidatus Raymondbacteria bacterium RIFOXYC2_FULL_50_21]OGK04689.1 MAG
MVSTPIGNLGDLSLRAIEVLKSVHVIAAEDTRHSGILLAHFNIATRMVSYHDHNKLQRTPELIAELQQGRSVAVISDAGTPGIADPAFHLVREAIRNTIDVVPVPGASALLAALVASGFPTDRFVFENFLPAKEGARKKKLEALKTEERTVVFYESPHRLLKTLAAIQEVFGDIPLVVGREITKKFERFYRGKTSDIASIFEKEGVRGEIVVLFNLKYAGSNEPAR